MRLIMSTLQSVACRVSNKSRFLLLHLPWFCFETSNSEKFECVSENIFSVIKVQTCWDIPLTGLSPSVGSCPACEGLFYIPACVWMSWYNSQPLVTVMLGLCGHACQDQRRLVSLLMCSEHVVSLCHFVSLSCSSVHCSYVKAASSGSKLLDPPPGDKMLVLPFPPSLAQLSHFYFSTPSRGAFPFPSLSLSPPLCLFLHFALQLWYAMTVNLYPSSGTRNINCVSLFTWMAWMESQVLLRQQ